MGTENSKIIDRRVVSLIKCRFYKISALALTLRAACFSLYLRHLVGVPPPYLDNSTCTYGMKLKLTPDITLDKGWPLMTSSSYSPFLGSSTKWETDNQSQILLVLYWVQILSDMLGWQKNYIHGIIMPVTWLGYNLQTE